MEEDFTTELPCTLSIEDTEQNISECSQTDEVRLIVLILKLHTDGLNLIISSITLTLFDTTTLSLLQFQFKEIVLTEEEKRLLSKEGATIPTHMPLTKVKYHLVVKRYCLWQPHLA